MVVKNSQFALLSSSGLSLDLFLIILNDKLSLSDFISAKAVEKHYTKALLKFRFG